MTDSEPLALRKKRVLYRAEHRGTQELDILIGGFVADRLATFDAAMLDRIEALLDHEETELQAWLMGQAEIPAGTDAELIADIMAHRQASLRA